MIDKPYLFLFLPLLSACAETGPWEGDLSSATACFHFETTPASRATDDAFEDGDEIGIYAVRRNGNTIGTILKSGNVADNRRYIYRDGTLTPATGNDAIYPPAGSRVDFYAYYPYRTDADPTALDLSASPVQQTGSNYKASDHLLAKNEGGFTSASSPVSLAFRHIQGLVEVRVAKNGTALTGASVVSATTSQTGNLQTGVLTPGRGAEAVGMLPVEEDDSHVLYRAVLPGGNRFESGSPAFSFALADGTDKVHVPAQAATLVSGEILRYELNMQTWQYHFRYADGTEEHTERLTDSDAGTVTIEVESYKTDTSGRQPVSWSAQASAWVHVGPDGKVSYDENPDKEMRTQELILTQAESGKTIRLTVKQQGKTSIDIDP